MVDSLGRRVWLAYRVIGSIMAKMICGQVGRMVDILEALERQGVDWVVSGVDLEI